MQLHNLEEHNDFTSVVHSLHSGSFYNDTNVQLNDVTTSDLMEITSENSNNGLPYT